MMLPTRVNDVVAYTGSHMFQVNEAGVRRCYYPESEEERRYYPVDDAGVKMAERCYYPGADPEAKNIREGEDLGKFYQRLRSDHGMSKEEAITLAREQVAAAAALGGEDVVPEEENDVEPPLSEEARKQMELMKSLDWGGGGSLVKKAISQAVRQPPAPVRGSTAAKGGSSSAYNVGRWEKGGSSVGKGGSVAGKGGAAVVGAGKGGQGGKKGAGKNGTTSKGAGKEKGRLGREQAGLSASDRFQTSAACWICGVHVTVSHVGFAESMSAMSYVRSAESCRICGVSCRVCGVSCRMHSLDRIIHEN